MEQALFVSCLDDLRHAHTRRYDRIYFGVEVCHWLMPSPLQLRSALDFAKLQGLPLTLVTPVLPEVGLERVRPLLALLPPGSEVVVNDLGLIPDVSEAGHHPLLGRILLKVKRDPRIGAEDLEHPGLAAHLRASNVTNHAFQALLRSLGIQRIELDNVQQGYDLDLPDDLRTSLYRPYVSAAVTRRCGLNFSEGNTDLLWRDGSCREHCQETQLEVSTLKQVGSTKVWASYQARGASLFYANHAEPEDTEGWNLDREVHLPRPPVFASLPPDEAEPAWDSAYREQGLEVAWNHAEADPLLLELAGREPPLEGANARAVELGCGTGRNAAALQDLGFEVLGIERSPAALALLREHHPAVQAVLGDVLEFPLADDAHALVADYGCLHALAPSRWGRYAERVKATLAPGGRLLLFARRLPEGHAPEAPVFVVPGGLPEWGLSEAHARELFGPSLSLEEVVPYEGAAHASGVEQFNYFLFRRIA
ncbi:MAG: class I SAM-dependent methyltransferase [Deltaproteobacteria bacterium]|nr:class I SAM-dependent methyltransferase [Deltaproteobacteria bacterium]